MSGPAELIIPEDILPDRADKVLAACSGHSRSSLARLMKLGLVRLQGREIRPSSILNPGDRLEIISEEAPEKRSEPEVPDFRIILEDEDVIVVDKPPGLVVHPGAGRPGNTLMDALIRTRPEMIGVGEPDRWGVVHRLDRDTSGVMVLVKNANAHAALSAQFKEHSVHRIYLAVVRGNPGDDSGTIDAAIGRHHKDRKRISTATGKGRHAVTRWRVLQRLNGLALLEVTPETGRTHQIRVHLASVGLPVAGDPVYGRLRKKGGIADPALLEALKKLNRQALHAAVLGFIHPRNAKYVEFSSRLPADIQALL
ncbi:MAG: RluA family pseudouridine synthase [Desulfomonile tiedjei]|uniref:Pseudouridine synthase n=1 Tax=Desulfomonile tiedjei TaxID=2358 RepID=A0A9D6Z2Z1_9BACT|nr:RluA family pseudouridine synthase [Desulfomonile tiedjei]